jgi:nucleoside-diphosphate kinase
MEQTIVLIDNISLKRSITGKIIDILLRTDLEIIGMKMFVPREEMIRDFCSVFRKDKIAGRYIKYSYLNKRILAIVFQGENAVEKIKNITGRKRAKMKKEYWHGTTIRGMYFGGSRRVNFFTKVYENVVQIPSTQEEASRLIKLLWAKYKESSISLRHLRGYEKKENEERTFIMLKPDAVEHKIIGKIIDDLSKSGLYIVGAKVAKPTVEQVRQHYSHLKSKGMKIFRRVVNNIYKNGKAKVMQLVYQGPKGEVMRVIREIIGATDPREAAIGTIRRSYGKDLDSNVIHASSSLEDTERELALWDTQNELIEPIIEYSSNKIFQNKPRI